MCRRTEEDVGLAVRLPRHRYFVRFSCHFKHQHHGKPFYGCSEKPPNFSRLLRRAWGYGGPVFSSPSPGSPQGTIIGRNTVDVFKNKQNKQNDVWLTNNSEDEYDCPLIRNYQQNKYYCLLFAYYCIVYNFHINLHLDSLAIYIYTSPTSRSDTNVAITCRWDKPIANIAIACDSKQATVVIP